MIHRKSTHSAIIKQCTKYVQGTCQFQENYYWYNYEKQTNGRDTVSEEDVNDEDDTPSVFQEAVNNPKPPSKLRGNIKVNVKSTRRGNRKRTKNKNISKSLRLVEINAAGLKNKLLTFKKWLKIYSLQCFS